MPATATDDSPAPGLKAPPGASNSADRIAAEISKLTRAIVYAMPQHAGKADYAPDKLLLLHKRLREDEDHRASRDKLFTKDGVPRVLKPTKIAAYGLLFGFGEQVSKYIKVPFDKRWKVQKVHLDRMRIVLKGLKIISADAPEYDDEPSSWAPFLYHALDALDPNLSQALKVEAELARRAATAPRSTDLVILRRLYLGTGTALTPLASPFDFRQGGASRRRPIMIAGAVVSVALGAVAATALAVRSFSDAGPAAPPVTLASLPAQPVPAAPQASASVKREEGPAPDDWDQCRGASFLGFIVSADQIEGCTKVLARDTLTAKERSVAYTKRGAAYSHTQATRDLALADLNEAIRLDPQSEDAYNARGEFFYTVDKARAIADYSEAIRLNPENTNAFSGRAAAYSANGDWSHAAADYGEVVRLNPADGMAAVGLKTAQSNLEAPDAKAKFNEAIRRNLQRQRDYIQQRDADDAIRRNNQRQLESNQNAQPALQTDDARAKFNEAVRRNLQRRQESIQQRQPGPSQNPQP
jgi:tetratricopeptide (TPR) repeat protein